jgi:hypothetical protein
MRGKTMREQLIEARAKLQREIDTLREPSVIGGPAFIPNPNLALIAKLKVQLREIDDALAVLGHDNG